MHAIQVKRLPGVEMWKQIKLDVVANIKKKIVVNQFVKFQTVTMDDTIKSDAQASILNEDECKNIILFHLANNNIIGLFWDV